MKLFFKLLVASLIIALTYSTLSQARQVKEVEAPATKLTKSTQLEFIRPKLPEGTPPGGRRTGGGRRDSCPDVNPKLTALVPMVEQPATVKNVWGLTTEERPTFWFYLPYTKISGYPTEFVLQDETTSVIYQKSISLPQQPGIISVSIPPNISPLVVDKQYRWFLNVYCNPEKQSTPIYVEGVVSRVQLSAAINQQLRTAQPEQKLAIYAHNGIWYQALATAVQLKQENPHSAIVQANWKNLLADIGLSEIADKELLLDTSMYSKLHN